MLNKLHTVNVETINKFEDQTIFSKNPFLEEVILVLKKFALLELSHKKAEILDFLASSCLYKDKAIYMNQEKILRKMFFEKFNTKYPFIISLEVVDKDERNENDEITLHRGIYLVNRSKDDNYGKFHFTKIFNKGLFLN